MDKIRPNEYVRTIDGKIGAFDRYSSRPETSIYKSPFDCFIKIQGRKTPLQCIRDYIKAHSTNIIDLIEEGDYVNGKLISSISKYNGEKVVCYLEDTGGGISYHIYQENIKTIVTKEQLERIKFVIDKEE